MISWKTDGRIFFKLGWFNHQGCRFCPRKTCLETNKATDGGTKLDLNVGEVSRVWRLDFSGHSGPPIYNPDHQLPKAFNGRRVKNGRSQAGYAMHVDCGHNGPLDEAGPASMEGLVRNRLGAIGWRWLEWLMMSQCHELVSLFLQNMVKQTKTDM